MITMDGRYVVFSFYRPGAKRVCVAGDFNGWKIWDLDMKPLGDGNWQLRCPLPPGEYRFRYCADGEWFADYAANGLEPGRFGMDSLLTVPAEQLQHEQVQSDSHQSEASKTTLRSHQPRPSKSRSYGERIYTGL